MLRTGRPPSPARRAFSSYAMESDSHHSTSAASAAAASTSAFAAAASSSVLSPLMSPSSNQSLSRGMATPVSSGEERPRYARFPSPPEASTAAAAVSPPFDGGGSGAVTPDSTPATGTANPSSLAKRTSAAPSLAAASSSSAAASSAPAAAVKVSSRTVRAAIASSSSAATRTMTPAARAELDFSDSDDESERLLSEEELSIENYMRRHPCVLDQGSSFLDRHKWVAPLAVACVLLLATAASDAAAVLLGIHPAEIAVANCFVLVALVLFVLACLRSPGHPPHCDTETAVIQLLHSWPASGPSAHYGLHASEWSRSWSWCDACAGWRPGRSSHCRSCGRCVLMRDHHCPWIGQCVGANNAKVFAGFNALLLGLSLYEWRVVVAWFRRFVAAASALAASASSASSASASAEFVVAGDEADGGATLSVSASLSIFLLLFLLALAGTLVSGYLSARCGWVLLRNETGLEGIKKAQWKARQQQEKQQKDGRIAATAAVPQTARGDGRSSAGKPASAPSTSIHSRQASASLNQRSASSSARSRSLDPPPSARVSVNKKTDRVSADDHDASRVAEEGGAGGGDSNPAAKRYFSPFQCACHAESFRVFYCQSFNYPSLVSSSSPIPPLPFYYDYDTSDWRMNAFLFREDVRRCEKLHAWVADGSKPIRPVGLHMRQPEDRAAEQRQAAEADVERKNDVKSTAMYM